VVDRQNPIGEFLRARRERVRPEDVGLPDARRRRVPGLRREELALLAGVSNDYYVRLEQGRHQRPSAQVLDALARALRLDDDATVHLHELAKPAPSRRRPRGRSERVRPELARLLGAWAHTPAFIAGRRMDVLAANELAAALTPMCQPGTNIVRAVFLDPGAPDMYSDWDQLAQDTVAALRALVGTDLDDPILTELIGELSLKSDAFRRLWARHDVRARADGTKRIKHPIVGQVEVRYETFAINGTDGQTLVVYHCEPDSASAHALALLSGIIAGEAAEPTEVRPAG
jgi:transcriptional regulator with XRE-family HTH domain